MAMFQKSSITIGISQVRHTKLLKPVTRSKCCVYNLDVNHSRIETTLQNPQTRKLALDCNSLFATLSLNALSKNDLKAKYERLVSASPDVGYSQYALKQREHVLHWAFYQVSEYRKQGTYDLEISNDNLLGALMLLQETGYVEKVLHFLEQGYLQEPLPQKTMFDLNILLGICHFDLASLKLKHNSSVLEGVQHLENGCKFLQVVPGKAKQVLKQIQAALEDLRPQYLQEVLALPIEQYSQEARQTALEEMQDVLTVGDRRLCMEVWKGVRPHLSALEQIQCHSFIHPQVRNRPEEIYYALLAQIAEAYLVGACSHLQQAQSYLDMLKQPEYYDVVVQRQKSSLILEGVLIRLMLGDFTGALQLVSIPPVENDSGKQYTEAVQDFLFEGYGVVCTDDVKVLCGLCLLSDMFLNNELRNNFREFLNVPVLSLLEWYSNPSIVRQIESKDVLDGLKRRAKLLSSPWVLVPLAVLGVALGSRNLGQAFFQPQQQLTQQQVILSIKQAKQIVKEWQRAKANALGIQKDIQGLQRVLDKKQLEQWRKRAVDVHSHGWHWKYSLQSIKICNIAVENKVSQKIEVELSETAELLSGKKSIEVYQSTYIIEYIVQCIEGCWKIIDAQVVS